MDNKLFFRYTEELKSVLEQPKTFRNRLKARKIKRTINKLIKDAAKRQSMIVYNQTVNLYQDILTSNLV